MEKGNILTFCVVFLGMKKMHAKSEVILLSCLIEVKLWMVVIKLCKDLVLNVLQNTVNRVAKATLLASEMNPFAFRNEPFCTAK